MTTDTPPLKQTTDRVNDFIRRVDEVLLAYQNYREKITESRGDTT